MNQYFKEVLDAHELIKNWLGCENTNEEVCENLLSRFSPSYSMVTPTGSLLDFAALNTFFRSARGTRLGLSIQITDMKVIAQSDSGATVVYKESQQVPGNQPSLRFSTVVFELDSNSRVIWRHLHETSLPE